VNTVGSFFFTTLITLLLRLPKFNPFEFERDISRLISTLYTTRESTKRQRVSRNRTVDMEKEVSEDREPLDLGCIGGPMGLEDAERNDLSANTKPYPSGSVHGGTT